MTRQEAIAILLKANDQLGLFRDPTDPDAEQEAWARAAGLDALEAMLELASDPPAAGQTGRISPDAFEFEVARMLSLLANQHPQAF